MLLVFQNLAARLVEICEVELSKAGGSASARGVYRLFFVIVPDVYSHDEMPRTEVR